MTPSARGCQHCAPKRKLWDGRQAGCRARCARSHAGDALREMGSLARGASERSCMPWTQNAVNEGSEILTNMVTLQLDFNSWCFPQGRGGPVLGVWVFLLLICRVIFLLSLTSLFSFLHALSPIKSHKRLSKVSLLFSLLSPTVELSRHSGALPVVLSADPSQAFSCCGCENVSKSSAPCL